MSDRLLLVEDETVIGEIVKSNLIREGFAVEWEKTGQGAMDRMKDSYYDALILDVMLPDRNGFDIAKWVRREVPSLPILMLTARSDTASKVRGLESGADDYLTKPFELEELLIRVKALLRRARTERHLPSGTVHEFPNGYWVNLSNYKAKGNAGEVVLKEKEVRILQLLIRRTGEIVTRSEILEEAWGMDSYPTERTVDNFIVNLRKTFEDDPAKPRHILSVRGQGYRFEP